MSKIPYTDGGGTKPYGKPFNIKFLQDVPKQGVVSGEETQTYIMKMAKHDAIMLYPPYGKKDFYIVCKTEDEVLNLIEFLDMPEYNKNSEPPIEPSTEVVLPY